MPLLGTKTLYGFVCSTYENGVVKVGTNSQRISLRLKAGQVLLPVLRDTLIKKGIARAEELPEDADEAAAMPLRQLQVEQPEPEQPAVGPTVLFGAVRCKAPSVRPGDNNEVRLLASDLGKAWEAGSERQGAEAAMHEISRKNHQVQMDRNAAKQATLKRIREESTPSEHKAPCLCTAAGARELLHESMQREREALKQTMDAVKIAKQAMAMAPSRPE